MANSKAAGKGADLEKIIQDARDRRKNEALAAKIFGTKDRRASTPLGATPGAGIKKTRAGGGAGRASLGGRSSTAAAATTQGNINGEWTHDLHDAHSAPPTPTGMNTRSRASAGAASGPSSLAARMSNPSRGIKAARGAGGAAAATRAARVAQALSKADLFEGFVSRNTNNNNNGSSSNARTNNNNGGGGGSIRGMTIRGLAGPYAVMAQNFAPGTTAADIESAMTRYGGLVSSCRLVKTAPIVIAEIVFESKEGADAVITQFDGQTADGRVLSVYHKPHAGPASAGQRAPAQAPSAPRADRGDSDVVDGTLGFDDPMDTDGGNGGGSSSNNNNNNNNNGGFSDTRRQGPPRGGGGGRGGSGGGGGGLYSDSLVRGGGRRGRGFQRGR